MKILNKVLHAFMALALLLMLTIPAFATASFNITINGSSSSLDMSGTTYTAYKLFDVTGYNESAGAYTYAVANNFADFTYTPVGGTLHDASDMVSYVYSLSGNTDALNAFTGAVKTYITASNPPISDDGSMTATASNTVSIPITGGAGYYIVLAEGKAGNDQTVTALCALTTAVKDATVDLKADAPTIDKQVYENSPEGWGKVADYSIGQNVPFKLMAHIPSYADQYTHDYTYIIHDTLDRQMAYNTGSLAVKNGTNDVAQSSSTYVLTTDTDTNGNTTITLTFASAYIKANQGTDLTITYNALLTDQAKIYGDHQENTVYLQYSNNPYDTTTAQTEEHKVSVYTYQFNIHKYYLNSSTKVNLAGAQFRLYSDSLCSDANEIKLANVSGTSYRPVVGTESGTYMESGSDGMISIKGLDAGTYYLKETKAPDGFNLLSGSVTVTISRTLNTTDVSNVTVNNASSDIAIEVENSTGGLLPTTGGMGTRMFYAVGGTLTAGAGIVLVTRKRIKNEK